jgi:hypothetical protein
VSPAPAASGAEEPKAAPVGTAPRPQSTIRAAEEINLLEAVGVPPAVKYAAAAVGGLLVGLLVAWLVWRQ